MIPLVIRLPLDPTGVNPDNKIVNEPHKLSGRRIRAAATHSGAFFSKSMIVTDTVTGVQLTKDQWYAAELYQLPSKRYGAEICAIVIITDTSVSNDIALSYQALGDVYSTSQEAIVNQIERLQLDTRPVAWGDIIGKPPGYTPAAHLHDAGDIYGFEYLVFAVDRIRDAIIMGDVASHDAIYAYIDHLEVVLRGLITSNGTALQNHIKDVENPHKVTAGQINVYTKQESNLLLSQAISNINNALNARIDQEVGTLVGSINTLRAKLDDHIANVRNPHNTTAAQTGAYSIAESNAAITISVTNASNALNARITSEIATVNQSIATAVGVIDSKFSGIYRGHAGVFTTGTGTDFHTAADAALSAWITNSGELTLSFHASNGGAASTLTVDGTSKSGRIYQLNSTGQQVNANITAGLVSALRWNAGSWLLVDALPPTVKQSIGYYTQIPGTREEDSICVPEIGILDYKTVGNFTHYFSKDLGKLFYDVGPTRPWCIELNGTWLNKSQYRHLWAWAQATGQVTIPQWSIPGMFFFVDIDANTFAIPDLRNIFVRGYGTDDVGSPRPVGYVQQHQLGYHGHTAVADTQGQHRHGSSWGENASNSGRHGVYNYARGLGSAHTDSDNVEFATSTDGNHTHNVQVYGSGGNETRPTNVSMSPRIQIV